ncbi:uncharacterized protein VTP21DRAFT_1001 [Calcarisporiella thermophila]|uniref:uncharacterized protein n=1 Tax=Calcarisporiella thermophila TaxID=911321 RepID=UPI0037420304
MSLEVVKDFAAGNFAGMAQVIVGQPLDTVKTRLQIQGKGGHFKGPLDCFMKTLKYEGVRGLYKGMASPLVGIGAVNALLFAANSRLKAIQQAQPNQVLGLWQIAIAGAGAGAINSILASPVELLKVKLQGQYGGRKVYSGPIDCAKKLIAEAGIRRGLFRGFWATVARETPAYAGFYTGFEFMKRKLTPPGEDPSQLEPSRLMIAGACGGISYWLCCYPLDVVKSRVQHAKDTPRGALYIVDTIRSIYHQEGARAFIRGLSPTILRAIPAAAATFVTYEMSLRAFAYYNL